MQLNPNTQIIPELPYTWREALTQGSTGVMAQPTEEQINNVIQLANLLIPIIELIGSCSINSWLRTPEHNAQVGGAGHSAHLLGAAVDLHPLHETVENCKALISNMIDRKLFFERNTTTWLHLDFKHNHDFLA